MPEPVFDRSFTAPGILQGKASILADEWARKNETVPVWSQTDMQHAVLSTVAWNLQTDFVLQSQPVDQFKTQFCPYVMEATIDILALSFISMAMEHKPGTCRGEEVARHEYKHFKVNKYILEQSVEKMRRDLPRIIRDLEMEGYVPNAEVQTRIDAMRRAMSEAIDTYLTAEVSRRMNAMNNQTDSPEEYERLNKLLQLCDIKDAMAKGDKGKALEHMKAFKGTPPAESPVP